ncbi:MAG: hypothetical protein ABFC42_10170 [Sulfuricella sp.]
MMRYFVLLPLALAFEVVAKLSCWWLPLFAELRNGPALNNNAEEVGPRLPRWLAWFDTPDNSLWGDTGWRTEHCPDHWDDYLGMVLWLWRNSACGFSRSVLAARVLAFEIDHYGDPYVSHNGPHYGAFYASDGLHFQFKAAFPLAGLRLQINLGWQMDTMVKNGAAEDLCHYKFSIKVKRP